MAMHNASLPLPSDLAKLRLAMDAVALEHPEEERAAITAHPHSLRVAIRPADARTSAWQETEAPGLGEALKL